MERNSLNEALKRRAAQQEKQQNEMDSTLDDSRRIKVLSPTRLVIKRFVRNRLAVVGICILIFVFAFSFLGPFIYTVPEKKVFKHYDYMPRTYATAVFNDTFVSYELPGAEEYPKKLNRYTNSHINQITENGLDSLIVRDDSGEFYVVARQTDNVYYSGAAISSKVGEFKSIDLISDSIDTVMNVDSANDIHGNPIDAELLTAAISAFQGLPREANETTFALNGGNYLVQKISRMQFRLFNATPSFVLDAEGGREQAGSTAEDAVIAENLEVTAGGETAVDIQGNPVDQALLEAARLAFQSINEGENTASFEFEGKTYTALKTGDTQFSITTEDHEHDAEYDALLSAFVTAINEQTYSTVYNGVAYLMKETESGAYELHTLESATPLIVSTNYSFNLTSANAAITNDFKIAALTCIGNGNEFSYDGATYSFDEATGTILDADGSEFAVLSNVAVVDNYGADSFSLEFKNALIEKMTEMKEVNAKEGSFVYSIEQYTFDKDGTPKLELGENATFAEEELTITELTGTYTISRNTPFYVTNKLAPMSWEHPFGTDLNGMDILARMMYGGRISLMIGFVVVFISMFIGVIMGGIAGYFGGWVDTLIMRIVEVFYCIPTYPILIILGGYMDSAKMDATPRLYIMMAVLGILGWAGTARLVRGQILSLREQEFMIATEATGVRVRFRIFRHLVPNVMPQLIVSATGSLGGVILTESSLSFLGLGVKYPMATWGNMLQFVTNINEFLAKYIYIWMPVGVMICITVIAFNFVGDGLRDAFDPKMKR